MHRLGHGSSRQRDSLILHSRKNGRLTTRVIGHSSEKTKQMGLKQRLVRTCFPESHQFIEPQLEGLLFSPVAVESGQKHLAIGHRLGHCHIERTHQRPPLFKHLPCCILGEVGPTVTDESPKVVLQGTARKRGPNGSQFRRNCVWNSTMQNFICTVGKLSEIP